MSKSFRRRAVELEVMDDFSDGGPELREALGQIRQLNRIFGAAGPTLYGVKKLWREAGAPRRLTVLDIGAGSGDVNKALLRWADEEELEVSITLSDITEEACAEARLFYLGEPRVCVQRSDLFDLRPSSADIVTGTQFVHHFPGDELPNVVGHMLKASRIGVVINDLHRHWMPWTAVWLMVRLISANRFVKTDAPLSVAKGFRAGDWRKLQRTPGLEHLQFSWRPLFRYVAVINKQHKPQ
ncbi:methyltransferase domain-containing protein [Paenibacillus physcomitrellae]|uniref:Methyltransferase domain-containing protein n=1 Tax=Paenibacillus physcomitrellae TaxID=1619311 RepID=A0ABQ1GB09_9BACL|nr:methyltransferase domain-containing protein [Paenibacillus physcomitrellae]GGA40153.1 hypothetical protein GCM10010917_26790 [Paenibacillus physcomitrellae]